MSGSMFQDHFHFTDNYSTGRQHPGRRTHLRDGTGILQSVAQLRVARHLPNRESGTPGWRILKYYCIWMLPTRRRASAMCRVLLAKSTAGSHAPRTQRLYRDATQWGRPTRYQRSNRASYREMVVDKEENTLAPEKMCRNSQLRRTPFACILIE